jgi:AT-rich interactive domain-containing protein 1
MKIKIKGFIKYF